ncbi:MAG: type II secretion system protein GspD [Phycisphaerales bacterium]
MLVAAAAPAQNNANGNAPPAPPATPAPDAAASNIGERIELPGTITLRDLIELASSRLAIDVLYDTRLIENETITLRLQDGLPVDRLWALTTATLRTRGFEVLFDPRAQIFRIVRGEQQGVGRIATSPIILDGWNLDVDDAASAAPGASVIEVFVRPRGTRPEPLVTMLQPVVDAGGGVVAAVGQSPYLRIKGPRTLVGDALRLGDALDTASPLIEERTIHLTHIPPAEALAAIERWRSLRPPATTDPTELLRAIDLAPRQEIVIRGRATEVEAAEALVRRLDAPADRTIQTYALPGVDPERLASTLTAFAGESGRLTRVVPDALTGVVIVEATPAGHTQLESFVATLSATREVRRPQLIAYELRHRDPEAVRETLERLLATEPTSQSNDNAGLFEPAGTNANAISNSTTASAGADAGPRLISAIEPPRIETDLRLNRLVVLALPEMHQRIRELIALLDRREPQVMLEVALLTMSESEALSFGAELQTQFDAGQTSINLASLFGLASEAGSGALATGTGFTGIVIRPGDYSVTLRALRTVNRGRNISTPMVVTNNNEPASVRSVATRPFTSINASNTVATTSFGGESEAGTTITVTPRIAAGEDLVLRYAVELSAFTGESIITEDGGVLPPPRQTNTIEGSVTVPDGFTVVVGGLLNEASSRGESRVPVLGQIPLIGPLFGTTSESSSRDRFYVFINAQILRDAMLEDLRLLSAKAIVEGQLPDDGHPRIEPRWIE